MHGVQSIKVPNTRFYENPFCVSGVCYKQTHRHSRANTGPSISAGFPCEHANNLSVS